MEMYYKAIGMEYEPENRLLLHTQPRCAFGVALSKHLGDALVGHVMDKDRTTIIHYRRKHDANILHWPGYDTFYETAEYIVDSYLNEMAKADRMAYIDSMIVKMVQEKVSIQSQINV